MGPHDYSAQQALDVLMRSLRDRSEGLAAQIQAVIDAGRDVDETEPVKKRPKPTRTYRKTVPYSFEGALEVALTALQAYFIEQPRFINSSLTELAKAALESRMNHPGWTPFEEGRSEIDSAAAGQPKAVEIELRTETQISESARETFSLSLVSDKRIGEQLGNVQRLRELLIFANQ